MHILTFFRKQIYKHTDQSTSITFKNTVGLQLISATTFAFRSSLKFHLNAHFKFFSTDRPTDQPTLKGRHRSSSPELKNGRNEEMQAVRTDSPTIGKTFRDAFKKKRVNFWTLAQKGGGGQSKIPNVDQYRIWDI